MHLCRPLRDAAYPLLVASQAIPIVVLAPILVLAFDYGIGPEAGDRRADLLLPDHGDLLDGLRSAPPELLKLMRSWAPRGSGRCARSSCPPRCPRSSAGSRMAATVSVIGAVFGERAGADEGLGRLIFLGNNQLETPRVYAGVVILTVMAVGLFALVRSRSASPVPGTERNAL